MTTISQSTLEQESEKGYESDVNDSGSELSFGATAVKALATEPDVTLNSLLGTFDSWPSGSNSASREGSLDGEKGAISAIPEDGESLNDSSSKGDVDSSLNQEAELTELDCKARKDGRKMVKTFWKDSDGGEDASSDSEMVPASFTNPMHGTFTLISP